MLVRQNVAERRDHESGTGADFDTVAVDAALEAGFVLDFGVETADYPNEYRRISGRPGALCRGTGRERDEDGREQ